MAATAWRSANVDEGLDARVVQQDDELLFGESAVPNGEESGHT
jgi:hypothetical protein